MERKNNRQKRFMRLAIAKAKKGIRQGQTPFGACIVKDDKVISCEHNTVWKDTDITAHAEIVALRAACRKLKTVDLSGCIIYSTCEPCPMCYSACHWANISKIVYGARVQDAKRLGFDELPISNATMKRLGATRIKIEKDFLRRENLKVFSLWRQQKDRRVY